MSDDKNPPKASVHDHSTATSPADSRPRRFEPITHDQDDDDENDDDDEGGTRTIGTIRRNRPPAISVNSGDNHGMFSLRLPTAEKCC